MAKVFPSDEQVGEERLLPHISERGTRDGDDEVNHIEDGGDKYYNNVPNSNEDHTDNEQPGSPKVNTFIKQASETQKPKFESKTAEMNNNKNNAAPFDKDLPRLQIPLSIGETELVSQSSRSTSTSPHVSSSTKRSPASQERRLKKKMMEDEECNTIKRRYQIEEYGHEIMIFLTSGMRTKKVKLPIPTTLEGLELSFKKAFYTDEGDIAPEGNMRRECFMLRHQDYGVEYEGFNPLDIYPGAVIRIREKFKDESAIDKEIDPSVVIPSKVVELVRIDTSRTAHASPSSSSQSSPSWRRISTFSRNVSSSSLDLQFQMSSNSSISQLKSKIWITLEDPSSSTTATAITIFILCLILFSTITFCLETMPTFYEHEKKKTSVWYIMEAGAIACFTLEFALRVLTCPNFIEFSKSILNAVDFLAIAPFYIELLLESVEIPGLSVLRVVRLVRVFRLFKVSRGSITIFAQTMVKSAKPLYMLVFFTSLATILFSSLMYYCERGVYDEDLHAWMRIKYYECETLIRAFPPAEMGPTYAVRSGVPDYNNGYCKYIEPQPAFLAFGEGMFLCPFNYKNNDYVSRCWKVYEQSPFSSIPRTCWWALTTMTTVGYGDMYPTQWYGQLLGVIVMMFGIIVIALPITVIGSNFTTEYKLSLEKEASDSLNEMDNELPADNEDSREGTPKAATTDSPSVKPNS